MNRRTFLILSAGASALGGCDALTKTYTLRYRLKLYVHIDGKEYSGASVFETRWFDNGFWAKLGDDVPKWQASTAGDALTIDLGPNGFLFGLLNSIPRKINHSFSTRFPERHLYSLLPDKLYTAERIESGRALEDVAALRGEYDLTAGDVPMLVRFSDLNNPKTAALVQPEEFPSVYGEGSRFDRMTVSITRDAVTRGIEKRLPWLDQLDKIRPSGIHAPDELPLYALLERDNFKVDRSRT